MLAVMTIAAKNVMQKSFRVTTDPYILPETWGISRQNLMVTIQQQQQFKVMVISNLELLL